MQSICKKAAKWNKATLILLWSQGRTTSADIGRDFCPLRLVWWALNWEIYTLYASAAGILLHINGKFTMGKLKSSLLSLSFALNPPSLSISRCRSR
jgi:hypothetical protein